MSDLTAFKRLENLAKAEHEALLSGDMERIADLLFEKTTLASEIHGVEGSSEQITVLRGQLERNQTLLDHSLAGLRAVLNRLGVVRTNSKSLETYDAQGRRSSIQSGNKTLEHRV